MSDALLSAPVALAADALAVTLLAVAATKIRKDHNPSTVPLMGVAGAFVFAAQMVNFAIPGTGSSGHIIGGVLLAALLGPWAGFIALASVIIIQCLVFADGGLMALGCNLLNMGVMTTLLAYPLIYRPVAGLHPGGGRIMAASVLACLVGLEAGAILVWAETMLSGVTAMSSGQFLGLMAGIHLPIGICEGVATGLVLLFVRRSRPELLERTESDTERRRPARTIAWLAVATVAIACGLAFFASELPDGLEWSVERAGMATTSVHGVIAQHAASIQHASAVMPDYDQSYSGIAGAAIVLVLVWALSSALTRRKKN